MFPMLPKELDSITKKLQKKQAKKNRVQKQLGSHNPSPPTKGAVWWSDSFKAPSSAKSRKRTSWEFTVSVNHLALFAIENLTAGEVSERRLAR